MRRESDKAPHDDASIRSDLDRCRAALGLADCEWYPCNTFKLEDDFKSLDLWDQDEREDALRRAAAEVDVEHYDPPPPPGTSDEPACRGLLMRAFSWRSSSFGCDMYFKFGFGRDGYLRIFSLHAAHFRIS